MGNSTTPTANVEVNYDFVPEMYPTPHIRWRKPSMTAILQQYWIDQDGKGEWRNVEIVREE